MPTPLTPEIDKGYILMTELSVQPDISQRDLSKRTGLSLGSVNLLLQKMIRQGWVKMETIPANRVIYMLTPKGMAEKAIKTVRYIRNHYHIIEETRMMIIQKINEFHQHYGIVYIIKAGNELDNLIDSATNEYQTEHPDRVVRSMKINDLLTELSSNQDNAIILYLPADHTDQGSNQLQFSNIPMASLLDSTE